MNIFKFTSAIAFIMLNLVIIAQAADPVVKIRGTKESSAFDGIDFYNLDPSNADYVNIYNYYAVITNDYSTVPQNATVEYLWIPVGGTAISGNNAPQPAIKWNNTKNYNNGLPTKSLRVKITFKWKVGMNSFSKEVYSVRPNNAAEAQPIEVKYISEPSTLGLNGSTLSNGNTLLFACGATQKSLTVNGIVTDPNSAVTYFFYYPDGWSGPASSNVPSVTINSHINKSGVIKVEAKRNDTDNFRTKISINITRPLPTIPVINSGSILLCNPVTITASANNATSYKWIATGGITANSPGNTNSAQITGVSDGTVSVAAVSSVCAVTSTYSSPVKVKRSAPLPASLLVTANGGGSPDFMCNGSGVSLHAETEEPGTSFGAWVSSDPANTILNYNGGSAYFNSYNNSCYGVTVLASNCFGSVQKGITICVDNCIKSTPTPSIHPNPASAFLDIALGEREAVEIPEHIKVISEAGSRDVKSVDVITDGVLRLNVSDLPRGVYQIVLIYKNLEPKNVRVVLE